MSTTIFRSNRLRCGRDRDGLVPTTIGMANQTAVTNAKKGDTLRVMTKSESGWGHMWEVRDFTMTIFYR